ncbi:hypothetical protein RKD54_001661 [Pseudarthrobacter sp. SLBN-100]
MVEGDALTALDTALDGLYNQERFLQLTRNFTAFDQGSGGLAKRIAKPHQYYAVTKRSAYSWPRWMLSTGRPAANRCRRRSSGCWGI